MAIKNFSCLSISIRMLRLICLLNTLSSGTNQQSHNKARKLLLAIALDELVADGVRGDNLFATDQVKVKGSDLTIYSLGKCMMHESPRDCYVCLSKEAKQYKSGRSGISVPLGEYHAAELSLYRSCSMTYQLSPFFPRITTPEAEIRNGKSSSLPFNMISLGGLLVVVVVALAYYYFVRPNIDMAIASRRQKENGGDNEMKFDTERLQFDLARIQTATSMFSEDNKLGEGGFGAVFKGTLSNGQDIAVKRLSKSSGQGAQEFKNEVVLVAKLQHRNLVRLLGFCLEGEETMLVYEYVLNKSLDHFLFDLKRREQLDWPRRCMIIAGIARGILYLHEDSRLRVIHRDLKASNILLDADMNPKISDFGLAKMLGVDDQTCGTSRRIVGTYGYMAPEYAMQGSYSTKSDVFSFGVLLLEIVTGRRNFLGFHLTDCAPTLVVYAWQLWNEGKGLALMDLLLKDSCSPDEFLRCIHIGLLCVQEDSIKRPTMSSVVVMLTTETIPLAIPERPGFFAGSSATSHRHKLSAHSCSPNGMTISDFMPR